MKFWKKKKIKTILKSYIFIKTKIYSNRFFKRFIKVTKTKTKYILFLK